MTVALSNDPKTQLVTLNLESDTTIVVEGLEGVLEEVEDLTGTLCEVCDD